jgi:Uma2 family endonuclease
VSEDQFFEICQYSEILWIERSAEGAWQIMLSTGPIVSMRNVNITWQLGNWAQQDGTGVGFGSSTGFRLPNTAVRAPDAGWLPKARLASLSADEWEKFPPLCPDFVLELWSPSDRLSDLQAKMDEYLQNGAQLGWLLYPPERCVYVYRPGAAVERLDNHTKVSGNPVLRGFELDLTQVW